MVCRVSQKSVCLEWAGGMWKWILSPPAHFFLTNGVPIGAIEIQNQVYPGILRLFVQNLGCGFCGRRQLL